jgi:hypothetical protein
MAPLALTDQQLAAVMAAAGPLPVHARDGFLQRVAELLRGHDDPGDGDVHRAICSAQKQFWDAPIELGYPGKYASGRRVG